jgi:hypothetical protein
MDLEYMVRQWAERHPSISVETEPSGRVTLVSMERPSRSADVVADGTTITVHAMGRVYHAAVGDAASLDAALATIPELFGLRGSSPVREHNPRGSDEASERERLWRLANR